MQNQVCLVGLNDNPSGAWGPSSLWMAGVREKKIAIINVKVYALAFYADPTLKDSLPAEGGGYAALFKAVADGEFHSILFLCFHKSEEYKHHGLPYTTDSWQNVVAPCVVQQQLVWESDRVCARISV